MVQTHPKNIDFFFPVLGFFGLVGGFFLIGSVLNTPICYYNYAHQIPISYNISKSPSLT